MKQAAARIHPMTEARKKADLSMGALAQAMGCSKANISKIENMRHLPSPDLAHRLAEFLNHAVTRDELLFPKDYVRAGRKPVQSVTAEAV